MKTEFCPACAFMVDASKHTKAECDDLLRKGEEMDRADVAFALMEVNGAK